MGSLFTPDTPPNRNIRREFEQTLRGLQETAPEQFALESQYAPQYAALYGGLNTQQRGRDIADVANLGPTATAAYLRANPYLAGSLNTLYGRMGGDPLLGQLQSAASGALASGGRLTPQEEADVAQRSREVFAQHGLANTLPAAGTELLNRDAAIQGRLGAARTFAQGVEGLTQAQNAQLQNTARIFSGTLTDPFQAILGRPSQSLTANQLFNPASPYASDVYNTNYNAQAAANIAGANNNAAILSAFIQSIGQVAGAAAGASDRRVKKNVKRIGTSPSGMGIYEFEYKGRVPRKSSAASPRGSRTSRVPQRFIGPIAQDVERKRPDAVFMDPFTKRIKMVDMSKIDVPFQFAGKE